MNNEVSIQQSQLPHPVSVSAEEEIWKTHSSGYEVSSFGRVRGKSGYLKSHLRHGYPVVSVSYPKRMQVRISKLVLETFLPDVKIYRFIACKDGNKLNNHLCNLSPIKKAEVYKPVPKKKFILKSKKNEQWAVHPYLGYEISSLGRIKGRTGISLRLYDFGGYKKAILFNQNNKTKHFMMHRLVWEAFNGFIEPDMVINHKDLNKSNNKLSNLEKVTKSENSQHWMNNKRRREKVKHKIFSEKELSNETFIKYGDYFISSCGRVFNKKNQCLKILIKNGYCSVKLSSQRWAVHRLVWTAFNGPILNGCVINHKNCNKIDNNISNLECVTSAQNTHHAIENNLIKRLKGEQKNNTNLVPKDIIDIYSMVISGLKDKEIAKIYNITRQAVRLIRTGKNWKHIFNSSDGDEIRKIGKRERVFLSEEKIFKIISLRESGLKYHEISKIVGGLTEGFLSNICNGKAWCNVFNKYNELKNEHLIS